MRFVKEVDPQQDRTIVVLTKLDLAPDRETTTKVLKGNVVRVKLGIVGVINRIEGEPNASLRKVNQFERAHLESYYPSIAHLHGMKYLTEKLNKNLRQHIVACCPELLATVSQLCSDSEAELNAIGGGDGEELTEDRKRQLLVEVIDNFSRIFRSQVNGQQRTEITDEFLTRGARLHYILADKLEAELNGGEVPFQGMKDGAILIAVRNSMPSDARMVTPEGALNYFIQKEIKRMAPIAIRIANLVYGEMIGTVEFCLKENHRFPKLSGAISSVVNELLARRMERTLVTLKDYFEVQSSSAVTSYPEHNDNFKQAMTPICTVDLAQLPRGLVAAAWGEGGGGECLLAVPAVWSPPATTLALANGGHRQEVAVPEKQGDEEGEGTKEEGEEEVGGEQQKEEEGQQSSQIIFSREQLAFCKKMRRLADGLFKLVRKQTQDYIAKALLDGLIFKTVDTASKELNSQLNTAEKIEALVTEPDEVQSRRMFLRQKIEDHNQALQLLQTAMNDAK